jgi:hypothetical protein
VWYVWQSSQKCWKAVDVCRVIGVYPWWQKQPNNEQWHALWPHQHAQRHRYNLNKWPLTHEPTKGGNVSDIHLPQDSKLKASELTFSGACGKHVTHFWHDLMICWACSPVGWNCLCKAKAYWWYTAWFS